jgi:hypothetical protein
MDSKLNPTAPSLSINLQFGVRIFDAHPNYATLDGAGYVEQFDFLCQVVLSKW